MFLHFPLAQLILYLAQSTTSNAGELGFDTYEWKPAASVSEAQRQRRPDGVAPKDNMHIISLARVDLGGHVTAGNFVPSAYGEIYFSWYNNGTPKERYVTDLDKWRVELLVHNLDSLSWVFNRGKLSPGTPGLVHVGKYENGQWAVVCRAVVPNSRKLYIGKYLWSSSNPNESSNACLIGSLGKEVAIEGFEVLQVNLIGKSSKKGYGTYPGISYELMKEGAPAPPPSGTKSGSKDVNHKKTKTARVDD